ncbi:MAG TPA: HDOD domain-containing protein [Spirochaetia bacterium]|nr:HDOD domain-containing protein [Spirochaetia bacterium]
MDNLVDRVKDLPIMPEVATKVMNLKDGGSNVSSKELEGIIKMDPGLTSKLLKIANSALYARPREVTSLQMAITLVGFKTIRNLVLVHTASSLFARKKNAFHTRFWGCCILSAFLARSIVARCQKPSSSSSSVVGGAALAKVAGAEEAFIAGLLHDIGQAILYNSNPKTYEQVLETMKEGSKTLEAVEQQMFGVNHRQIGGALLKRWNFPDLYVGAAEKHESLSFSSPHKSEIMMVSVAGLFAEKITDSGLPRLRADLLTQLLPNTCLAGMDPDALAKSYSEELARDPQYQEYQRLFAIA